VLAVVVVAKRSTKIGVHSMLYLNTPFTAKRAMFAEAAAIGASVIRLDISLSGIFNNGPTLPDWRQVDEYMQLARQYKLRVLGNLLATPWWLVACPPGFTGADYICPPSDPKIWGDMAGQLAKHTRGVINHFEIINEADGKWAFVGSAQQYANILSASYIAIHKANKKAKVSITGIMNIATFKWINAVFKTPGAKASKKFDIANVHIRSSPDLAGRLVKKWIQYFKKYCRKCPLWVTETGYPADKSFQHKKGYTSGEASQAKWHKVAFRNMLKAGAQTVFATERDTGFGNPFASEGFLQSADPLTDAPVYKRRQLTFAAVKRLAMGKSGKRKS
jgi:hypothetical protein